MESRRPNPPVNPAEVGPSSRPDHREEIRSPAPDPDPTQPDSQAPDPGAKISQTRKGKKHSPESRARMSEAHKGKKLSPEHRAKISEAKKGRKHSPESRARMSEAKKGERNPNYGKKRSPETRAKISEAKKGYKNYHYDQSIDEVRLAIAARVRGESMSRASLDQGFRRNWLTVWKSRYPERFQMLYGKAADELDRATLEADIGAYILGLSPEGASLDRDQAGIRLARRALRLCYDEDLSTAEASQELGLDPGWLDQYQQTHPSTYQELNSIIRHSRG